MTGRIAAYAASFVLVAACTPKRAENGRDREPRRVQGTSVPVVDTTIDAEFVAAGVAEPFQRAILSTKLMGSVVAVLAREGDAVTAGQPLVRIDARDLTAKASQVSASVSDAEAHHRDALAQIVRIRALYADSAATKAQLDAAETSLTRAEAGVRAAEAASAELRAVSEYAVVRAPFAGVVTQRFVDAGAFAAPGAPLVAVQDAARLRITVSAAPDAVGSLRRGASIAATIEGRTTKAVIEGVVPASAGNMYTVNAVVSNADGVFLAGSTASLALPLGKRRALMVPSTAVRREGDLTGVMVRTPEGDELRWVRVGRSVGGTTEVTSGLRHGDQVVIPAVPAAEPNVADRRK